MGTVAGLHDERVCDVIQLGLAKARLADCVSPHVLAGQSTIPCAVDVFLAVHSAVRLQEVQPRLAELLEAFLVPLLGLKRPHTAEHEIAAVLPPAARHALHFLGAHALLLFKVSLINQYRVASVKHQPEALVPPGRRLHLECAQPRREKVQAGIHELDVLGRHSFALEPVANTALQPL